ncbi:MAG: family 1 glycosylhydrolase, partial [Gammaproteobacteria bacterium]
MSVDAAEPRPVRGFPPTFLWGASTASHQVEGNNCRNDWWALEEQGRLPYRSGDACRQFELYEQDFDMARAWGHNAHRFSLEWSRIEPSEGVWDPEALAHYARVIRALRDRGMEPIVTLHHFTNPQWFAARGGWARADSVKLFRRYVEHVAAHLGESVRFWLTINEPTVYVKRAFVVGDWPPCQRRSFVEGVITLWNMMRAHRVAYGALHKARPDAMVGMAHSAPFVEPCNPHSVADRWCAFFRDFVLNRGCLALLGFAPRRYLDFLGINYYTRQIAKFAPGLMSAVVGRECKDDHHAEPRRFNTLGWEVFAPGLTR